MIKQKIEELKEISFKFFNFIILLPVYFLGVGISYLLWRFFESKNKKSAFWIKSKNLVKNIKKFEETYE